MPSCLNCRQTRFKLFLKPKSGRGKTYRFFKCTRCGLIQMNPQPTPRQINQEYSFKDCYGRFQNLNPQVKLADYLFGSSLLTKYTDWCNKLRFERVAKLTQPARLLDVGCSNGQFLEEFKGSDWRLFGLEVNLSQARIARQKLPKARIYSLPIEKIKTNQHFEVITLWHVLEHLPNPRRVIKRCFELSSDDGYLVIEVPNGGSFYFWLFGEHWQSLLLPEHLHFWSADNLRTFLESCGYEVIAVRYPGILNMSFVSSLSNFLRGVGVSQKVAPILSMLFFPISVIFNLGLLNYRDNLQIVAKKATKISYKS